LRRNGFASVEFGNDLIDWRRHVVDVGKGFLVFFGDDIGAAQEGFIKVEAKLISVGPKASRGARAFEGQPSKTLR